MEKLAFKMKLRPGMRDEYARRHDAIWPELVALLRGAGIEDYSIHLDPETDILFAVLWRADPGALERLPEEPVMRRWWAHMADIMDVEADDRPVSKPLTTVFHMT